MNSPAMSRGGDRLYRFATWTLLGGTLLNGLFNVVMKASGFGWPYDSFLFRPEDAFADYFKVVAALGAPGTWDGENPMIEFGLWHLTPALLAFYAANAELITRTGNPVLWFIVSQAAWIAGFVGVMLHRLGSQAADVRMLFPLAMLLSYPSLFNISRGNTAGLVCALVAIGVYAMECGNLRRWPQFLLALTINLKVTPLIFALAAATASPGRNLVPRLLSIALIALALGAASIALLGLTMDDYTLTNVRMTFTRYRDLYILGPEGVAYGSSLLNPWKEPFAIVPRETLNLLYLGTVVALPLLAAIVVYFRARRVIDTFECYALLAMLFVVLTPAVGDYYLLALFVPFLFLPENPDRPSLILFVGLLASLIPKHYLFVQTVSVQSVLNPLILVGAPLLFALDRSRAIRTAAPK